MDEPVTLKIATILQERRNQLLRKLAVVDHRLVKTESRLRQLEEMMAEHTQSQRKAA
jgi:hypothetical protein